MTHEYLWRLGYACGAFAARNGRPFSIACDCESYAAGYRLGYAGIGR